MVPVGLQHGTDTSENPGVDGRWRNPYPRSTLRPCTSNCHTCKIKRGQPCTEFDEKKGGGGGGNVVVIMSSRETQTSMNLLLG